MQAGKEWHLPSVDFNDPNRPKTCLEVDFPILPINQVAAIEGNAGKPIYQMSKWWARRRSSVFRAMLIAAATKAPDDPAEAAKLVWDAYYGNHQKNEAFRKLKVADIFMGGGTTVVEGARLGMQMYGNDLNPVAWFVVKNELAQVDPDGSARSSSTDIEAEVKPQIMPFYACDCPRGHKGKWTHKPTQQVMGPISTRWRSPRSSAGVRVRRARKSSTRSGPSTAPARATECGHRTPIMSSPVVAVKTLSVEGMAGHGRAASAARRSTSRQQEARMAPAALFVCSPDENRRTRSATATAVSTAPIAATPTDRRWCSSVTGKNKKIDLTLLVHPDWLKGAPGKAADGTALRRQRDRRWPSRRPVERRAGQDAEADRSARAAARRDRRARTRRRRSAPMSKAARCRRDRLSRAWRRLVA